jgi:LytS/YehU family sensor histidine kinase
LRAQLDPHFLFNTLNAIAEWCREDPRVAERAMLGLADMLRGVFEALRAPRWSLAREVELLQQLGALYTTRGPGRYVFRFDVTDDVRAIELPPLVLLPLFENAIKHGPAAGHGGPVVLVARRAGDALVVEIENPGAYAGRREGGQGIALVERRLALGFERRARVEIGARGAGTAVTVHLPAVAG